MITYTPKRNQKICNLSKAQRDVELCKLKLKQKGLSDIKIELLEDHIKVIISKVIKDLEYE